MMGAKVEQISPVGPQGHKVSSASGSRIPLFSAKSGFVIPKNKLSGSLVPLLRGGKKPGGSETAGDEVVQQVQRKTKWGLDLTGLPSVKRGRALAYQTRLHQITQLLTSGTSEVKDNQDSPSDAQDVQEQSSKHPLDSEKVEFLELERREVIGEILKLNPSYKAPSDYKPLMKEARVPIPGSYGHNFISLMLGRGGDTRKRLEKETGAKIQVCSIKAGTKEKVEISSADGHDVECAYGEIFLNISAETYEKVDAAVAVIEVLVASVSGNTGAASISVAEEKANYPITERGVSQPAASVMQTPHPGQFQYNGSWFAAGLNQTQIIPPLPQPSVNDPSNLISLFGRHPLSGPNSTFPNPSIPSNLLPRPYMPQMHPIDNSTGPMRYYPMPPQTQSSISGSPQFPSNQVMRPIMPSLPQAASSLQPRLRPLTEPSPLGSTYQGQMARPVTLLGTYPSGNPIAVFNPNFKSAHSNIPSSVTGHSALGSKLVHGDFTFQQNTPNSQMAPPRWPLMQPRYPQPPTMRVPQSNLTSQHLVRISAQPQIEGHRMGSPETHFNPARFDGFHNAGPLAPQMRPMNFGPIPMPNRASTHPPRQMNSMHFQQNYPLLHNNVPPNQQFNNSQFGRQHIYDPFSPTSTSAVPNQQSAKQEGDPEYEDFMDSVGVK